MLNRGGPHCTMIVEQDYTAARAWMARTGWLAQTG